MTEQQFLKTSRGLALGILTACRARTFSKDDTAAVASAALVETLGQLFGPVGAVERLRDIADVVERQLLQGCSDLH